ncbi:MAG: transposase [Candidatus Scalindua sp.]
MARPARIEYEGAFYHVMNRGNRKEAIFIDNKDRAKFYEIIGNIEKRYKMIIYSFVLMSNHYHILIETPYGNLSRAIQRLNGDYALYFAKRHKKPGHLFQGRFKAMLVEKETYLFELSRYIHLNPVRAGMVKSPEKYKWSSLYEVLKKGKVELPFTLYWDWLLESFGKRKYTAARRYLEFVREGIEDTKNPGFEASGGWILGKETWVKKIIEKWIDFSSKEITGIKPLKPLIPVNKYEKLVCKEFEIRKEGLKKLTYNNIGRMAIIYLAFNYCGLTLREIGQKYGGISDSAVNKIVARFSTRLAKHKKLNNKIKKIVSSGEM